MNIIHKKASDLCPNLWDQIRTLNQKIIPSSLYDQNLYNGGCLQSTCDNAISKAMATGSTEILLGFDGEQLISYMIFYCVENPPALQLRLDNYRHLGCVGYSDMLVVDPTFQKRGYSKEMRTLMRQIGKAAKVDVFMAFVRCLPIPNLSSFMALRQAGAVSGGQFLSLERKLVNFDDLIQDLCLEMIYPADDRQLTIDRFGKVSWTASP
ncbi:MAG: hypothetical protein H0U73_02655 [Tatlockia sp.]|nr:hypothetical protein [Tatlockia sp.]